jgi:hypothetical protein
VEPEATVEPTPMEMDDMLPHSTFEDPMDTSKDPNIGENVEDEEAYGDEPDEPGMRNPLVSFLKQGKHEMDTSQTPRSFSSWSSQWTLSRNTIPTINISSCMIMRLYTQNDQPPPLHLPK